MIPRRLTEMGDRYVSEMCSLTGIDPRKASRKREVVVARAMVAYALLGQGFTTLAVAEYLGKNHSTIIYYKSYLNSILTTPGYDDEKYIWEQFKQRI